ncbi:MAG: ADP-dependent NAD(P)H-hydrate dehydratase, partial [Solirubrobacterales bacterium]
MILDHCQGAAAVVRGSGSGRADGTAALVRQLVEEVEAPLVVDADALSLLGDDPGPIATRAHPTVITPHPGEMALLLGREPAAVEAQRLGSAVEEAARTEAVVVLKGDDSIVAGSGGIAIDDLEAPGLATAGTGDVLAGVCGAFLARGLDPFDAAAAAVFVHARAGRIAAGRVGSTDGMIASDVVEALPEAIGPLP